MTHIKLTNPTGRSTEARVLEYNGDEYFFSYQTCVAFRGIASDKQYRKIKRKNKWGRTTSKHFKEMGCADFQEIEDADTFAALLP